MDLKRKKTGALHLNSGILKYLLCPPSCALVTRAARGAVQSSRLPNTKTALTFALTYSSLMPRNLYVPLPYGPCRFCVDARPKRYGSRSLGRHEKNKPLVQKRKKCWLLEIGFPTATRSRVLSLTRLYTDTSSRSSVDLRRTAVREPNGENGNMRGTRFRFIAGVRTRSWEKSSSAICIRACVYGLWKKEKKKIKTKVS
jgi:hypothetical protein